jgi:argininosuccinate synthase
MSNVNKVVLAYSGGLDTSVIVRWLQDTYDCEVVTFTADIGQGEEVEPARAKAEALGVKEIYIDDLKEEFVRDFVFPMFRANTIYEGEYLLGTSIARPLIATALSEKNRFTMLGSKIVVWSLSISTKKALPLKRRVPPAISAFQPSS